VEGHGAAGLVAPPASAAKLADWRLTIPGEAIAQAKKGELAFACTAQEG